MVPGLLGAMTAGTVSRTKGTLPQQPIQSNRHGTAIGIFLAAIGSHHETFRRRRATCRENVGAAPSFIYAASYSCNIINLYMSALNALLDGQQSQYSDDEALKAQIRVCVSCCLNTFLRIWRWGPPRTFCLYSKSFLLFCLLRCCHKV